MLAQLDDAVDQARLAQLEAESKDTTQIRASKASLAQKQVDLQKIETAAAQKAATPLEVEHAKLEVTIAQLSLEVATFDHEQAQRKHEEVKLQVDNMRLRSPIDGSIEKIDAEVGESVNALESVVRVVQTDPLWIDVPVPVDQSKNLAHGDTAQVQFSAPDHTSLEGTIVFVAAVADAASATLRIRLEVPNKSKRPAGEHVTVILPVRPKKMEENKK